ncbi:ABC transporter G family member 20-like [Brevipalpus obovatus]|uniref:ABC transporter G family member 20-like n=1 Tax=Brevipalpus obovatus TaxID=246614 RepID=UPI003D9F0645
MDFKEITSFNVEKLVLNARNIAFSYNSQPDAQILRNISIRTNSSQITAIVGPSGCGKTTLINIILSLLPATKGEVTLFGKNIGEKCVGIPGPNVGYMPQDEALPRDLSVRQSLFFFGLLYKMSINDIRAKIPLLLGQVGLSECGHKFMNQLSGGMRRRVSLAIALIHSPPLMILDEPTVGCDPPLRSGIWDLLVKIAKEKGSSIVITTHYIEECRKANIIYFLRKGLVVGMGSPDFILQKTNTTNMDDAFYEMCCRIEKSDDNAPIPIPYDGKLSPREYKQIKLQKDSLWYKFWITLALICRYFLAFARSPASIFLCVTIPTASILLVHLCLSPRVIGAPIGIVIENQTIFADDTEFKRLGIKPICLECTNPEHFVDYMNRRVFQIVRYDNLVDAMEDVKKLTISGVLYINSQFSDHFLARLTEHFSDLSEAEARNTIVRVYGDAADTFVFDAMESYLQDAYLKFYKASRINLGLKDIPPFPFDIGDPILGDDKDAPTDKSYFTLIGGIIGLSMSCCVVVAGFSMITDITDKTLYRYLSTGLSVGQIFVAQTFANSIFMTSSTILTLFTVIYLIQLSVTLQSIVLASGILWGQALIGLLLGQLIATSLVSEIFILVTGLSMYYTIAAVSGTCITLESQPYYLSAVSGLLPNTKPLEALRTILLRNLDLSNPTVYQGYIANTIKITLK